MYYDEQGNPKLNSNELLDVMDALPLTIRSYEISDYIVYVDHEKGYAKLKFPSNAVNAFNVVSISIKIRVEIPNNEQPSR